MEEWEKVLISDKAFLTSTHGKLGCITCHGGTGGTTDKAAAHKGVIVDPSEKPEKPCGTCHADIVKSNATSLHVNQGGYRLILMARGADMTKLQGPFNEHCATCHATCGQCHVSRPNYTGGGLLASHTFKKRASLSDTCMACHSARIGNEYMGRNEGVDGDVHWTKGGMPCVQCHTGAQMHGAGAAKATRYAGKQEPACLDCHKDSAAGTGKVPQHDLHGTKVACQVCHSAGNYKQCTNCHVGQDAKGLPWRTLDPSWMDFKIGRNPMKSADRPYDYILVRHIPATPDLFGKDNLLNVNALPTWKYTTPHNIVRKAPQTATCNACHGNAKLFLTEKDVKPEELQANKAVIVTQIPPAK